MSDRYRFNNFLRLAISITTMGEMKIQERVTELLRCGTPTVDRSQALLDFNHWEITKTGEKIGHCLEDIHKAVVCKPEYIGSNTVDG